MNKTDFQIDIINRIRQLRTENDISQIKLANIIDVSTGQIGNIESPKFQHKYTLKQLYQISKFFNVPIDYILTGTNHLLNTEDIIQALIKYDE
ncbi:MAG: helix-turn-helix transcriptional regulator [Bacteroidales bacterium]|nr:helix-turn-helix transcriptional regulator [Bacteroidales bacterium]